MAAVWSVHWTMTAVDVTFVARGAISATERQGYILRVRALAHQCARGYLLARAEMKFPMLKDREKARQLAARFLADEQSKAQRKAAR